MILGTTKVNGLPKIKVVGVGGGGNNAVKRMYADSVPNVEFIAINTDVQALSMLQVNNRIQIGEKLTRGLGAGADPVIGQKAAEESKEVIAEALRGTDLLFLTAGMGGGTGTGALPVIAAIAREQKILTIAIVSKPFSFEGPIRMRNAEIGIKNLSNYVDTLIVIPNDKLLTASARMPVMQGFKIVDDVLRQGIQGISKIILEAQEINLDFADIRTVLSNKGQAYMGIGSGSGDNRCLLAVRQAVNSPILDTNIEGSTSILICFAVKEDVSWLEVSEAVGNLRAIAHPAVNIIFGITSDNEQPHSVTATIIATGFTELPPPMHEEQPPQQEKSQQERPKPEWLKRDGEPRKPRFSSQVELDENCLTDYSKRIYDLNKKNEDK